MDNAAPVLSPSATAAPPVARIMGLPWPLFVFILLQLLVWTLVPAFTSTSLPNSTSEIVMWGREWFWVNYKHPGLPSWSFNLAFALFGVHLWVVYLVGQLFVCSAFVFIYLLGRELLDEPRGMAAPMLLVALAYFTQLSIKFNHNYAQLPFTAAFAYWLWQASQTGRTRWWVLAAAAAALGLDAKFSSALPIAFGTAWIVFDPRTRAQLRGRAPYVGLCVFLAMTAPLVYELARTHFVTLTWISQESEDRGVSAKSFFSHQGVYFLRIVVLAVLGGAVLFRARRAGAGGPQEGGDSGTRTERRRKFAYLLLTAAGPLLLTYSLSLFMALRIAWTVPMLGFAGLLLLGLWPRATLARCGWRMLVAASLTSLIIAGQVVRDQYRNFNHAKNPSQYSFPMAEIAHRFDAVWARQVGVPLRIVGGEARMDSLVGLLSSYRPAMFSNLDPQESPSMTPERVAREGMLLVWNGGGQMVPDADWTRGRVTGAEVFQWSNDPNKPTFEIDYAIIPPGSSVDLIPKGPWQPPPG